MAILLTGGSGILGRELQKHIEFYAPSRQELDITRELFCEEPPALIVHCAAFTDLVLAEKEKELCYQTNVIGTRNLASLGIPMLYISTEYVFDGEKGNYGENDYPNPQNFYSLTKLLGESESRRSPRSVVIRCLFKPRPFKHDVACTDQFTTGDHADVIAKEIALAIKEFSNLPSTVHIGTGKKSTYELARESRPDIGRCRVEDIKAVKLPKDTSLNTTLWETLKRDKFRTN